MARQRNAKVQSKTSKVFSISFPKELEIPSIKRDIPYSSTPVQVVKELSQEFKLPSFYQLSVKGEGILEDDLEAMCK